MQAGVFLYDTTQLKIMTQQHPITPPPELLQLWVAQHADYNKGINELLIEAAQYGADQELEACIDWIANARNSGMGWDIAASLSGDLRAARRPKPPSLRELALEALNRMDQFPNLEDQQIVRRALEALPDD